MPVRVIVALVLVLVLRRSKDLIPSARRGAYTLPTP